MTAFYDKEYAIKNQEQQVATAYGKKRGYTALAIALTHIGKVCGESTKQWTWHDTGHLVELCTDLVDDQGAITKTVVVERDGKINITVYHGEGFTPVKSWFVGKDTKDAVKRQSIIDHDAVLTWLYQAGEILADRQVGLKAIQDDTILSEYDRLLTECKALEKFVPDLRAYRVRA